MAHSDKVSIGNSGEYFVAGELERHGFTAAVPMSNVKDFDILAIDRETHKQIAVQVKTTSQKGKSWTLNYKCKKLFGENIFYILVSLNDLGAPEYHIVPSQIVADTVRIGHARWLSEPGRNGQPHHDNPVRKFSDQEDRYLDRWDLLKD